MAYELLVDKDVDLSELGFGDNLTIEFNKEECTVRISVFERYHHKDQIEVNLVDAFVEHEKGKSV